MLDDCLEDLLIPPLVLNAAILGASDVFLVLAGDGDAEGSSDERAPNIPPIDRRTFSIVSEVDDCLLSFFTCVISSRTFSRVTARRPKITRIQQSEKYSENCAHREAR